MQKGSHASIQGKSHAPLNARPPVFNLFFFIWIFFTFTMEASIFLYVCVRLLSSLADKPGLWQPKKRRWRHFLACSWGGINRRRRGGDLDPSTQCRQRTGEGAEREASTFACLCQVPPQLSGPKAWNRQIKLSWRGNDSAPNQIYLRIPLRKIDVLSHAKDFNSLCRKHR